MSTNPGNGRTLELCGRKATAYFKVRCSFTMPWAGPSRSTPGTIQGDGPDSRSRTTAGEPNLRWAKVAGHSYDAVDEPDAYDFFAMPRTLTRQRIPSGVPTSPRPAHSWHSRLWKPSQHRRPEPLLALARDPRNSFTGVRPNGGA